MDGRKHMRRCTVLMHAHSLFYLQLASGSRFFLPSGIFEASPTYPSSTQSYGQHVAKKSRRILLLLDYSLRPPLLSQSKARSCEASVSRRPVRDTREAETGHTSPPFTSTAEAVAHARTDTPRCTRRSWTRAPAAGTAPAAGKRGNLSNS